MSIISERTETVKRLTEKVKCHCMTLKFVDDGLKFTVIYPDGYFPQGCRVDYSKCGKAKALEIMLEKIEAAWQKSLWWK